MSFERLGEILPRVLHKARLRILHPDVFVLPQTQGGRWLLKRTIAFGGYVDGTPLSTVDFDEEYRELKEDRDDYFYSIGQPVDEGA